MSINCIFITYSKKIRKFLKTRLLKLLITDLISFTTIHIHAIPDETLICGDTIKIFYLKNQNRLYRLAEVSFCSGDFTIASFTCGDDKLLGNYNVIEKVFKKFLKFLKLHNFSVSYSDDRWVVSIKLHR